MREEKNSFEELKRENVNTLAFIAFTFVGAIVITLFALSSNDTDPTFIIFLVWIAAFILTAVAFSNYEMRFKETVIQPFVESKGLRYLPRNMVDERYIKESRLIRGYDHIDGSDLILGDGFSFSHVRATEEERDDEGHTETHVIFDGVFYRCKLPKDMHVEGRYFVHKSFINLDGLLPPIFSRTRIRLDHREFEYLFNVYGDDQIEGRYIFDHTFMEKLLSVYDKYKFDSASIVNGCLYIAFPNVELVKVPLSFSSLEDERIKLSKDRIVYFASLREFLFHKHVRFEKVFSEDNLLQKAQ